MLGDMPTELCCIICICRICCICWSPCVVYGCGDGTPTVSLDMPKPQSNAWPYRRGTLIAGLSSGFSALRSMSRLRERLRACCMRWRCRWKYQRRSARSARKRIPPTTPPTIAPIGAFLGEEFDEVEEAEGGRVGCAAVPSVASGKPTKQMPRIH